MAYIGSKPADKVLTASDITDGIVSNAKLAQDIISADTALGAEPADTDEFLVSDAGTLKRMDYSYIKAANTPAWKTSGNATSVANSTATKLTINTEQFDTDNKVASNKVTPGEGKFQVNIEIHAADNTDTHVFQIRFYKNGGWYQGAQMINRESNDVTMSLIIISDSDDYWEVFCQQQTGSTINVNISEFSGFKLIGV
jgi:hypothetical protein